MWACKTKAIQTDLSISKHILTCSGIIRLIQELLRLFRRYQNPCISRNLTYLVLIFAPLEKNGSRAEQGLDRMSFGMPWNFFKEQLLHNFMKYFSEA